MLENHTKFWVACLVKKMEGELGLCNEKLGNGCWNLYIFKISTRNDNQIS